MLSYNAGNVLVWGDVKSRITNPGPLWSDRPAKKGQAGNLFGRSLFDGNMVAGGQSRGQALGAAAVLGLATVLGVVLTEVVAPLASHGLAISAGVTIYVAASNLVPEFQARRGWRLAVYFFGGCVVYGLAHMLLS